jgi:hypothetical protein
MTDKTKFMSPLLFAIAFLAAAANAQDCGTTWRCIYTSSAPTLDGDLTEWASVSGLTTALIQPYTGQQYAIGDATYKCLYDDSSIYFAIEIPGEFSFNETDSAKCASIATMLKIGVDATYVNMGGCPDATSGCASGVPSTCDSYRVDIGAHWELPGTKQSVAYPIGSFQTAPDEYAVSPKCRLADDGANAANDWAGAWSHSNQDVDGFYTFELSRALTTASSTTDAQLFTGGTFSFGVAYWDPLQTDAGWTDPGHFVTGCAADWIELELANPTTATFNGSFVPVPTPAPTFVPATMEPTFNGTNVPFETTTPDPPGPAPPSMSTPASAPTAPFSSSDAQHYSAVLSCSMLVSAIGGIATVFFL